MHNDFKAKLKSGKTIFGTWNTLPSASVSEALAQCGLDFVIVDGEHGPISFETAESMARAVQTTLPCLMRVPAADEYLILKALDIGMDGVQVPHVSDAAAASRIVKAAKYAPQGERGFSPFTRAGKFGLNAKTHAVTANQNTALILNVEGAEGIKNLKDIVKVKEIDVVFIGPYDLSQSLGVSGQVESKEVLSSIRHAVEICNDAGVVCGSHARDKKYAEMLMEFGVRYITYSVDAAMLVNAYQQEIKNLWLSLGARDSSPHSNRH